ncbi:MAG: hypothetical protein A3F16_00530 [Deltaproteobacteria bacterium RIFCSPHIGHO2_12_FULL_43_9]|nr:MAG: hypothetical protein A3F16_00530 [Deltaproteobacteria bacterium RIFCSPHIGHO2_12_FULL_43_9]
MKILVTGAAGYIGSVLVPTLLQNGYKVVALDNFMYGQTSLLDCAYNRNLRIYRKDARDEEAIGSLLKDVDVIFPLACLTGAPLCDKDPVAATSTNLDAVKLILKLKSREQRVIFPTTNSGYGVGEAGVFCDENSPLKPISLYGRLKVDAEKAVLDSGNAITFRLATVFGTSPRMRLDLLVNDFTYRAVYDRFVVLFESHFKRNYVHVRDVVKAFLHGLNNFEKLRGEPYNLGLSDCNISKRELCEAIKKHVPSFYFVEAEIGEDPDKRNYVVSNKKIESTGFIPDYSLDDGIRELVNGYQIIKRNQYANI